MEDREIQQKGMGEEGRRKRGQKRGTEQHNRETEKGRKSKGVGRTPTSYLSI